MDGVNQNDRGGTTTYVYDQLDRQIQVIQHDGSTRTNVHNAASNITQMTDENGSIFDNAFDPLGRKVTACMMYYTGANRPLKQRPAPALRRGLDAFPVHTLTVSPFWIGQYEATNEQFERFMKSYKRTKYSPGDTQPAIYIHWRDAVAFCKWLSKKDGRHYRLPTSAEWEFAARGGLKQKLSLRKSITGWTRSVGRLETMFVGSYAPNRFELYDMAGNVKEWVQDWYEEGYYLHCPEKNPKGPLTGLMKITRGDGVGAWIFMSLQFHRAVLI